MLGELTNGPDETYKLKDLRSIELERLCVEEGYDYEK